MKRIYLLCMLLISLSLTAANEKQNSAVTMISYEQSWLDKEGTLALKNQTPNEIKQISFQITYLDMQGNPLDYENFKKKVSIAPGMVKKIDIPSYEHRRFYHYYKTGKPMGHPMFKIKFKLIDYHSQKGVTSSVNRQNSQQGAPRQSEGANITDRISTASENDIIPHDIDEDESIRTAELIGYWFFISLIIVLYITVAMMALSRNRNAISWLFMSMFISPIFAIVLLFVAGKKITINPYDREERQQDL